MSWQQLRYPGYCFNQWPKWAWHMEFWCPVVWLRKLANLVVLPYHIWLYRYLYKQAVERRPHLHDEILDCADFPEFLRGL
jgi:hypothetical protein